MATNWHSAHQDERTTGQVVADYVARAMGSWPFIIVQTVFVAIWLLLNLVGWVKRWDPYPFILLNLLFSVQAAYAAPVIMMSQNRQAERDRAQAQADYDTNVRAESEVERILAAVEHLEREHLLPLAERMAALTAEAAASDRGGDAE